VAEGLLEERVLVDDPLLVFEVVRLVVVALGLEPPEKVVLALLARLVQGDDLAPPALALANVLDDLGNIGSRIVVAVLAGLLNVGGEVVVPGAPRHVEV